MNPAKSIKMSVDKDRFSLLKTKDDRFRQTFKKNHNPNNNYSNNNHNIKNDNNDNGNNISKSNKNINKSTYSL